MITRAQAEALLTLAEALEACERLDVTLHNDEAGLLIMGESIFKVVGNPTGIEVRLAVNDLLAKHTGS